MQRTTSGITRLGNPHTSSLAGPTCAARSRRRDRQVRAVRAAWSYASPAPCPEVRVRSARALDGRAHRASFTLIAVVGLSLGGCSSGHTSATSSTSAAPTSGVPSSPSSLVSRTTLLPSPTKPKAAPSTTSTTTPAVLPAEPGCLSDGSQRSVRPTSFLLACADGNYAVDRAQWRSWVSNEAIGSGAVRLNDCVPSCAAGHFHTQTADLALYAPRIWHGHLVFTRLRVHLHGPLPPLNVTTSVLTLI